MKLARLFFSVFFATPAFALPSVKEMAHVVLMRGCTGCGHIQVCGDHKLIIDKPDPNAYQITLALMNREKLNPRESKKSIDRLVDRGSIVLRSDDAKTYKLSLEGHTSISFQIESVTDSDESPLPFGLSIILPMYNNLSGTIACVSRLLSSIQAPKDLWEIIVVDDGCPNADGIWLAETLFVYEPYAQNCRVVWSDKKPGTYRNVGWPRNSGAKAAKFAYLAFCDSDRFHLSDPVTPTLTVFRNAPESMVLGQNMIVSKSNESLGIVHEPCPTIGESFEFPSGWIAVPHNVFFALHGYDQRFDCWAPEDSDMIKRLRYYGLDPSYLKVIIYVEAREKTTKHRDINDRWRALNHICIHDHSLVRNLQTPWGMVETKAPHAQNPPHLKPRG